MNWTGNIQEPSLVTSAAMISHLSRGSPPQMPARALILDQSNQVDAIAASHKVKVAYAFGLKYAVLGPASDELAVVAGLGIGGPAMGIAIELLKGLGVERVAQVGTAGALVEELQEGEILVISSATTDDGTAVQYLGHRDTYAGDAKAMGHWHRVLGEWSLPSRLAKVWTTSAPFRETTAHVERYRSMGAIAVEMEGAAAIAVGEALGVSTVGFRIVSDHVLPTGWRPNFRSDKVAQSRRELVEKLILGRWP